LGPDSGREPLVYSVRFPDPSAQLAEIEAVFPTGGQPEIELRMPIWSPGFYRVQDYAARVRDLSAVGPGDEILPVSKTRPNRWRIETGGAEQVRVTYVLHCPDSFVTTNWVSPDLLVLNGPATYLSPPGDDDHPYEVHLEPAPTWNGVATGLAPSPDGIPNHFRADDYDTLLDSPIVAGDLTVTSFQVGGVTHVLVDVGEREEWDSNRAAEDLRRIIGESLPLWGELPYSRYVFLNVFRRGGGGLEHGNSTLLTTGARAMATPESYRRWLGFAVHEYFHAFNVKRLRPVELGPFDFEEPPTTPSLWLSEGVTSYFAGLFLARAGVSSQEDFLASLSSQIGNLQSSPGRLLQSLEQSSLEVWTNSNSGVGAAPTTVSYYVKGEVVGFLLDARIRRVTGGERSLQDVMRLAYQRYGGERGFRPQEFEATAEEVAGVNLGEWFRIALATTEELDYSEALDWYGLRFAAGGSWVLEAREDAAPPQRAHLAALLSSGGNGTVAPGQGPPLPE
jgi:predicted metalloprotease with PDZ domain